MSPAEVEQGEEAETLRKGGSGPWQSRLGEALAAGAVVFAALATYAFVAPATYRTSATIGISKGAGVEDHGLPPLEAARRLRGAVLDRQTVQRIAEERLASGGGPAERESAAHWVEAAIDVDSVDARSFTISCSESSALRAQRLCTELATRAVQVGPRALRPEVSSPPGPDPSAQQRAEKLVALLEAHPELTPESRAPRALVSGADPSVFALNAERSRIQAELAAEAELAAAASSDNPYDAGSSQVDTSKLKRRLIEIDRALVARRPSRIEPPVAVAKPTPELRAELQRLITEVQKTRAAVPSARPGELQANVIASAALPTWPVEPNRIRLLVIGAILGLAVSLLVARLRRVQKQETSGSKARPSASHEDTPIPEHTEATSGSPEPDQSVEASAEVEVAPTLGSTQKLTSEPPKRPSSSPPRKAAIEINAAPARTLDPRIERDVNEAGEPVKVPMARTQSLGSPMPVIVVPHSSASEPGAKTGESRAEEREPTPKTTISGNTEAVRPPAGTSAPALNVVPAAGGWAPDATLSVEARLALRDELYALAGDRRFVVAVTGVSGTSAEKSRVAAELALCLSQPARSRVLLLEANFQRPFVHRLTRVEMPRLAGFSEQLKSGEMEGPSPWTVVECSRSLHVLGEGLMRVPEMIVSPEFRRCIAELRMRYDFVVIDGPLLSEPSACRAVDSVVDGAIVVHSEAKHIELERASASFPGKCISSVSATG